MRRGLSVFLMFSPFVLYSQGYEWKFRYKDTGLVSMPIRQYLLDTAPNRFPEVNTNVRVGFKGLPFRSHYTFKRKHFLKGFLLQLDDTVFEIRTITLSRIPSDGLITIIGPQGRYPIDSVGSEMLVGLNLNIGDEVRIDVKIVDRLKLYHSAPVFVRIE